jgi:CBS domain-containing protein
MIDYGCSLHCKALPMRPIVPASPLASGAQPRRLPCRPAQIWDGLVPERSVAMENVKFELTAADLMSPDPICVEPSTTLRQLAQIFAEYEISGAPVVDPEGRVIGLVSKTDLIRRCVDGVVDLPPAFLFEMLAETGSEDGEMSVEPAIPVEDFMTEDPLTVTRETPAGEIAAQMCERRMHRVIVVDDQHRPIGIITSLDMACALSR